MVRNHKIITLLLTVLIAVSGANAGMWQDTKEIVANAATNTVAFVKTHKKKLVVGAAVATVVAACYYTGTYPKQLKIWLHKNKLIQLMEKTQEAKSPEEEARSWDAVEEYICDNFNLTADDLKLRLDAFNKSKEAENCKAKIFSMDKKSRISASADIFLRIALGDYVKPVDAH